MKELLDSSHEALGGEGSFFAAYLPLIRAADGLTLSQVCSLTGLEQTTIQNWIKRGFVPHPEGKKYRERHLARILLIHVLRDSMQLESIGVLLSLINGDTDDESDDIIREDELYDLLCKVVGRIFESPDPIADIPRVTRETAADYPTDERSSARLCDALEVMAVAVAAGRLKREAENKYNSILEKYEVK